MFEENFRVYGVREVWRQMKREAGRNIVVNRAAVRALAFRSPAEAVGMTVDRDYPRMIVGVVDRLRFFSPRVPEAATYYRYDRDGVTSSVAAVRFVGDPATVLARVWRVQQGGGGTDL